MSFYIFSKNSNFGPNPNVLAYGFTENRQLAAKTDQNSVFPGCDHHILDRLYLMVSYMSFYRFF
jgi:hypothetical protein